MSAPKRTLETGWLIERGGCASPMYWQGYGRWSGDHQSAIRFARRQDAMKLLISISLDRSENLPPHTAVEHAWGPDGNPALTDGAPS